VDADVNIEYGNENVLKYDDFSENTEIESYVENEKWYLNVKPKSDTFISKMLGFSFTYNSSGDINLKITQDIFNISINGVKADLFLNKIILNNLYVKSVSGDTKINNSKIKFLEFYTTSGDLETTNSPIYSLNIKTVSGDIDLYVAGEKDVFINKNTSPSGDIHTNLPLKFEHSTKRFINFKSVSGDLNIKEKKIIEDNFDIFEESKKNNLLMPEEKKY
jgi:DUF4097 and DUF4098 domain-containing protein YvlB